MAKLVDTFPSLVEELSFALRAVGREALAGEVERAVIERVSFDSQANAAFVRVQPSRGPNVVEANIIGVRHGSTIPVETRFWTALDLDNFERLMSIEILDPGELLPVLQKYGEFFV